MRTVGRIIKILLQVYGILALIVTVAWTVSRDATARETACPWLSHLYGHQLFCGVGYEVIPNKQAGEVLFQYFETADASGFPYAWDLLDPGLQNSVAYKGDMNAYGNSVTDTLWGETMRAPDRSSGLNEFIAHIRVYQLDGDVVPYAVPITLQKSSDGRVLITRIGVAERDGEGQRQPYSWAYFKKPTSLHARPRQDSDLTLLAQDNLQTGGHPRLRALCEIDLAQHSANTTAMQPNWWTLTNQGWISNSDLTVDGNPLGILRCSPYVIGR